MLEAKASPALPRLETWLVGLTMVHLCWLPWAFGGMHLPSQFASLALSAAGLLLALCPRNAEPKRRFTALLRFPIFWAGLALELYVVAQAVNPAWRYITNGNAWWLAPLAHVAWLPTSVAAPFSTFNPWRSLIVLGSAWLLLCSLGIGFTRRRSFRLLFGGLAANGAVLSAVGYVQRLTGATKIFWTYVPSTDQFVASFIYRNHAGAYFNLIVAVAAGMTLRHYLRARRQLESPAWTVVFGFATIMLGVMVVFSYSRMAIVLLFILTVLVGGVLGVGLVQHRQTVRGRREIRHAVMALAAVVVLALISIRSQGLWKRFSELLNDPTASLMDRVLARSAGEDMLASRWVYGWGAGCFRYGFPLFAQRYPQIYSAPGHKRKYWEHVHDDLLEFPIELGAVGMLPIAAALALAAAGLVRRKFWRLPLPLCATFGCVLVLLHAWLDFVFQCPAVLLTWSVLLLGAVRLAESEISARRINRKTARIRERGASSPV